MPQHISGSSFATLRRWRRVVASHHGDVDGLAAIAFRPLFAPREGFVPLEAISAAVLVVEPPRQGRRALSFSAFGAHPIAWGVSWGGADECKLSKNLALRPRLRAQGWRIDLMRQRTLNQALDLFEAICQAQPRGVTDRLQLPDVWAGFPAELQIDGDGPELDGLCSRLGLSQQQVMARRRRIHEGLQLFPLDFVSHLVERAHVFVEPGTVPATQVIACTDPSEALAGFRGANEFSFVCTMAETSASVRSAKNT